MGPLDVRSARWEPESTRRSGSSQALGNAELVGEELLGDLGQLHEVTHDAVLRLREMDARVVEIRHGGNGKEDVLREISPFSMRM